MLRQDGFRLILVNLHPERSYDIIMNLMSSFRRVFSSSVGTKLLIGLTGLLLFAYLLLHLAGNLLVFAGPGHVQPLLPCAHLESAGRPGRNRVHRRVPGAHLQDGRRCGCATSAARPAGYEKKAWAGHTSRKSLASTTMIWTGLVILVFIGVHLQQFKFGAWYEIGRPADPRPVPDGSGDLHARRSGSPSTSSAWSSSACTCGTASPARSSRSAPTIRSTRNGSCRWDDGRRAIARASPSSRSGCT